MGVVGNLRQAIVRWGSVRAFARAMEEKQVPGGSYAQINRYLAGTSQPPGSEFLLAAAEVLQVRPEWLLTGQGAMTEQDEERRLEDEARIRRSLGENEEDPWLEGMKVVQRIPWATLPVQHAILTAVLDIRHGIEKNQDLHEEEKELLLARLEEIVPVFFQWPLSQRADGREWVFGPEELSDRELHLVTSHFTSLLRILFKDLRRGELSELLRG